MSAPWVGYVRVSFVGDRRGDRFRSPTEQAGALEAWATARGERIVLLAPELNESGARADRPILAEALDGIDNGRYCGIVVAYLSRLSRSTRHLLEIWDRVERAGGQVVALAENIDTSTPTGRLTRTMIAAIDEHTVDMHRERFEQQNASAVERGIWPRRQTPRGYDRDPETRKLTPNSDAPLVVDAFRSAAAGAAHITVARTIGMTASGVRHMLANRVYLGELRIRSYVNTAAHPPLVTDAEWQAAQRRVAARPARSDAAEPALLAGLVLCSGCGHVMSRSFGGNVKPVPRIYTCHRHHSLGQCPGPAAIYLDVLDAHVTAIALAHLARLQITATRDTQAINTARVELAAARDELAAYLAAVSAIDVGVDAFAAGARQRRDRFDTAQRELDLLLAAQRLFVDDDPVQVWERAGVQHRQRLLSGLIESVLVGRAGRGRRVPVEDRVRVIAAGSDIARPPANRGSEPLPIVSIALPDRDDPRVLRV